MIRELDRLTTDIEGCARCGGEHNQLAFTPFRRPMDEWTHWAMCPVNGEPIVLRMVKEPTLNKSERLGKQIIEGLTEFRDGLRAGSLERGFDMFRERR